MKVVTISGSVYEFNDTRSKVRRVGSHDLRRDGDWLSCKLVEEPVVGKNMMLLLEALGGEGTAFTLRTTNIVSEIVSV